MLVFSEPASAVSGKAGGYSIPPVFLCTMRAAEPGEMGSGRGRIEIRIRIEARGVATAIGIDPGLGLLLSRKATKRAKSAGPSDFNSEAPQAVNDD
jgi:hypothetical protein